MTAQRPDGTSGRAFASRQSRQAVLQQLGQSERSVQTDHQSPGYRTSRVSGDGSSGSFAYSLFGTAILGAGEAKKPRLSGLVSAERARFELAKDFTLNRFRDGRLQPLGHLSRRAGNIVAGPVPHRKPRTSELSADSAADSTDATTRPATRISAADGSARTNSAGSDWCIRQERGGSLRAAVDGERAKRRAADAPLAVLRGARPIR